MIDELKKLRELTETLTGNGYLRDQAEEWEYALDAIPDYIYIINTKFEIKFINNMLAERLQTTKSEIYGKLCYKAILDANADSPLPEWQKMGLCRGGQVIKERYIDNLDGWFNMSRSPIYTKTSKLLGFICVLQDVTERVHVKRRLQSILEKLKSSEQKYKLIVGNVTDAIWTIDTNLNFTFINPALKPLMGYEPEEWIGRNISEFTAPEDFKHIAARVGKAMLDPSFKDIVFETKMINKDGQRVDIEVNAKALRDCEGKLIGFQGMTRVL